MLKEASRARKSAARVGGERIKAAGFPSPADDFMEHPIDLNKILVRDFAATFYYRNEGEGMKKRGIDHGDLLVVDRAISPKDGSIVVCVCEEEFRLGRMSCNGHDRSILYGDDSHCQSTDLHTVVWGVVTHCIKSF